MSTTTYDTTTYETTPKSENSLAENLYFTIGSSGGFLLITVSIVIIIVCRRAKKVNSKGDIRKFSKTKQPIPNNDYATKSEPIVLTKHTSFTKDRCSETNVDELSIEKCDDFSNYITLNTDERNEDNYKVIRDANNYISFEGSDGEYSQTFDWHKQSDRCVQRSYTNESDIDKDDVCEYSHIQSQEYITGLESADMYSHINLKNVGLNTNRKQEKMPECQEEKDQIYVIVKDACTSENETEHVHALGAVKGYEKNNTATVASKQIKEAYWHLMLNQKSQISDSYSHITLKTTDSETTYKRAQQCVAVSTSDKCAIETNLKLECEVQESAPVYYNMTKDEADYVAADHEYYNVDEKISDKSENSYDHLRHHHKHYVQSEHLSTDCIPVSSPVDISYQNVVTENMSPVYFILEPLPEI